VPCGIRREGPGGLIPGARLAGRKPTLAVVILNRVRPADGDADRPRNRLTTPNSNHAAQEVVTQPE